MTSMLQRSQRRPALAAVLAAGAAVLLVAGCRDGAPRLDDATARTLSTPERRHPTTFSERTEQLVVEVAGDMAGLTQAQHADVYRFLRRYKAESTGRLVVSAPSAQKDHLAASRALDDVRGQLIDLGIGASIVDAERHASGGRRGANHIRISYRRPVTVPPTCGHDWSADLGVDRERVHYPDFGCATERNTALFVANPRDLMGPQPEDPRNGDKQRRTIEDYTGAGGAQGAPAGGGAPAAAKGKPSGGAAVKQ